MNKGVNDTFAMVIGAVLLLVGIWGLFTNNILFFTVNMLQSVVHIVGGLGIYYGMQGQGKNFNKGLGVIAAVVAVLGFVTPDLMANLLNINMAITWLHVAIAVVSLGLGFGMKD